jgi:hypothetical protein
LTSSKAELRKQPDCVTLGMTLYLTALAGQPPHSAGSAYPSAPAAFLILLFSILS